MSSKAVTKREETLPATNIVSSPTTNMVKDNWLGFVGDVLNFTGEVTFKSKLRIDGKFCGQVSSSDGTLIVSAGAQVTHAVINVAVARINGTVEGDVNATQELVLGPTGCIKGNILTRALIVEEGARVNGSVRRIRTH